MFLEGIQIHSGVGKDFTQLSIADVFDNTPTQFVSVYMTALFDVDHFKVFGAFFDVRRNRRNHGGGGGGVATAAIPVHFFRRIAENFVTVMIFGRVHWGCHVLVGRTGTAGEQALGISWGIPD